MFSVPIIPPGLRHEETIVQAAHALACLERTIFTVFDTIDKRVKNNEGKIQNMQDRLTKAQKKLKGMVGSKKSITIYAPSRFPGTQILRCDIPSTFAMGKDDGTKEKETVEDQQSYEIKSRPDQPVENNEKLVFFHVRDSHKTNDFSKRMPSGLGQMPKDIEYVASVLLYGADEFVYDSSNNESKDSWKHSKLFKRDRRKTPQVRNEVRGPQLAPAPYSLTHRDHINVAPALRYTPRLRDLPDINLPLDLPDLPGIADDIQFIAKEEQRIAPSLLIEDLPDLEELEKEHELQSSKAQEKANVIEVEKTSNQPTKVLPNPPPPPSVTTTCPPPPPPPPPPAPPISQLNLSEISKALPVQSSSSVRSDLMAEIRKAGGVERARLRPAAPINSATNYPTVGEDDNTTSNDKPAASTSGGGLMAELHNKLQMRRKGISGEQSKAIEENRQSSLGKNPLLSQLSKMIPQTTKQQIVGEDIEDEWTD